MVEHTDNFVTHRKEIHTMLDQRDLQHKDLQSKWDASDIQIRQRSMDATQDLHAQMDDIRCNLTNIKCTVDRHDDSLKTAKEARLVIRKDVKKLVESMNQQCDELRHQIDEQKEWRQNRDKIWNKNEQDAQQTKLEVTAKLDYLAGRFKTLHEKLKETNENIVGIENEIQQWNAAQTGQLEQLLLQVNDQERTLEQTKASMTSMLGDVMGDLGDGSNIMKQITTLHDNYSKLVVQYNQLNTSLNTATIHNAGNSHENVVDNKEETHHRLEQVKTQLEYILQQVQCLETNQDHMKKQQAQLYQEQATLTDALMIQWNNGVDSTDENPTMPDVDQKPGLDIHPHRAMTKSTHQNIISFFEQSEATT
jgi:chromosome segregation ATPase